MRAADEQLEATTWEDLVGVRFADGGRSIASGLNCWGLVLELYKRRGVALYDPAAQIEDAEAIAGGVPAEEIARRWRRVRDGDERAGDVVAYSTRGTAVVDHVGVLVDRGRVIMATAAAGVVVLPHPATMRDAIAGVFRPLEAETLEALEVLASTKSGAVFVRVVRNLFDRSAWHDYAQNAGDDIERFIPSECAGVSSVIVTLNGGRVPRERWRSTVPAAGDQVVVVAVPEGPALGAAVFGLEAGAVLTTAQTLAYFALSAVFTGIISFGLSFVVQKLLAPPQPDQDSGPLDASPTYSQVGIRSAIGSGHMAPIVFGVHRVGGIVIGTYNAVGGLVYTPSFTGAQYFGPEDIISSDVPSMAYASGGKTTLNMAFILSEGECYSLFGFTPGSDVNSVLSSALPANALLINGNDARSFRDVRISGRLGRTNQDPLPNFNKTTNAVGYEIEARQNITFSHFTTEQVDGFEVQFYLPQGLFIVGDTGETKRKIVDWTFRYRIKGQTNWIEQVNVRWKYKNKAPHSNKWGRTGLARNYYEIQVVRLTGNDDDPAVLADDDQHVSTCYINAINEIRENAFSWPGWCVVSVEALASEQLSGQPTFTFLLYGKKWWVWDGVSALAPTFAKQFTTNPADCLVGFLLNPLFGFGEYVAPDDIDYSSLLAARSYCDEMIDDGRGGTMKRWEIGLVLDRTEKGDDVLKKILATFRATIVPAGSKIRIHVEKEETPSNLLGEGSLRNVKLGYADISDRPSRVSVQFANEELDYEIDTVSVEAEDIGDGEYLEDTVTLLGITKPARAYRAAQYRLNLARSADRTLTADAALDALTVGAGDVSWFAHQQLSIYQWSGRVLAATSGGSPTVTLDQDLIMPAHAAGWKVRVRTRGTGAFVFQERTIGGAFPQAYDAGTPIPVTVDWNVGDVPARDDAYGAGKGDDYLDAFRITSAPLRDNLSRSLEAISYDAGVFDDDPGEVPSATDRLHDPRKFPADLAGVNVGEETRVLPNGETDDVLVVSWTPADDFDKVDIFLRIADDGDDPEAWTYAGRSDGNRLELRSITFGKLYEISCVPVSTGGSRRGPDAGTKKTVLVAGRQKAPPDPTGFQVTQHYGDVVLAWAAPADPGRDLRGWEIRGCADDDLFSWALGVPVAFVPYPTTCVRLPVVLTRGTSPGGRYMIRAVSTNGVPSRGFAHALAGKFATYVRGVQTNAQRAAWTGTKTGAATSGSDLVSSASATSIAYETPQIDLGATLRVEIADLFHIKASDRTALTWDAAVFPWDSQAARVRDWAGDPFTDYPDSTADAIRCTWDMAGFTWDHALAKGRTWAGLIPTFFRLTHSYKGEDSGAALTAKAFADFVPQLVEWRYHAFKIAIEIPDDSYLVTFYRMTPGFYHRPEVVTGTKRTSAAGDVTITFPSGAFKEKPNITVLWTSGVAVATGWYIRTLNQSATGFDVSAYTAAGARQAQDIDYIAVLL